MQTSSLLRLACAAALLCSMSSFSGCEKDGARPSSRKNCEKPATATDTTKTAASS